MKFKKLNAMFMIFLLFSTILSFNVNAQLFSDSSENEKSSGVLGNDLEIDPSKRDQRDTGESIVINVDSYEPPVVESFLIEKDSVPVYAYLKGYTIGSLIGAKNVKSEPLLGDVDIRNIIVLESQENPYVKFVKHMPPTQGKLSLNNLGVVQIMLEKISNEKEVPDNIFVNLTAKVLFDRQAGLFGFGSQDLRLKEERNENKWLGNMGGKYGYSVNPDLSASDLRRTIEKSGVADVAKKTSETIADVLSGRNRGSLIYGGRTEIRSLASENATGYDESFWGGNGYIRLSRIRSDSAQLVVYDRGLKSIATETLSKNGIPKVIKFPDRLSGVDRFRIQLLDVVDPSEDSAKVDINVGGRTETKILTKGSRVYPESRWLVKEIKKENKGGVIRESILLKNDNEDELEIVRNYGDASSYNNLKFDLKGEFKFDGKILTYIAGESKDHQDTNVFKYSVEALKNSVESLEGRDVDEIFNIVPADLKFNKNFNSFKWEEGDDFLVRLTELAKLADASVMVDKNKIIIRSNKEGEVCNKGDYLKDESVEDAYYGENSKGFYCSAIREYEDVIKLFRDEKKENGNLYSDEAKIKIAKNYLELSKLESVDSLVAKSRALDILNSISERNDEVNRLIQEAGDVNVRSKSESFLEGGELVDLRLISVNIGKEKKGAEIYLSVNGEKSELFNIGTYLYKTNPTTKQAEKTDWYVESLEDNSVLFSGLIYDKLNTPKKDSVRVNIGKEGVLRLKDESKESLRVKVTDVNFNKEVYIRILPGVDDAFSESNFLVRIPIEKKLFDFNPKKIDNKIKKTEEKIKKLTAIIDKLEKLLEGWKKLCLAVFAFLTIKNSFLGGFAKNQARKQVVSGENGWQKYCESVVANKGYKSVDECMIKNNKYIIQDINAAKNSIKETNQAMKRRTKEREALKGEPLDVVIEGSDIDFSEINEYQKISGETVMGIDEERNLRYLINLRKGCQRRGSLGLPMLPNKKEYNGVINCEGIDNKLKEENEKYSNINEKYKFVNELLPGYKKNVEEFIRNKGKLPENADIKAAQIAAESDAEKILYYLSKKEDRTFEHQKENALLGAIKKVTVRNEKNEPNEINYWVDYTGTPYVVEANGEEYRLKDVPEWMKNVNPKGIVTNDNTITGITYRAQFIMNSEGAGYTIIGGKVEPLINNEKIDVGGNLISIEASNKFNIDVNMRYTYAPGAVAQYYEDGKPFCIPIRDGDYVRVNDYNKLNNPSNFDILNVGPDGMLCTPDDILRFHYSLLQQDPNYRPYLIDADRAIKMASNVPDGGVLNADGKNFGKSRKSAAALGAEIKPSCYDVMDPRSCQIMFNVCDPVMCPPSRFNLGGRWQLPPGQSVVQTGIIGSLFLGWPIITAQQPIPKVCMTGILAGLKNIRSLLQGYVRCLSVAKTEGKSVGICDKIRSIGICEMLWKEAIAIFKIEGGFVSLVSEKLFKETQGGGEYLTFQDSLKNVENSVNFFTNEYASTAFTAFKGRSLQDIGADICRSAVFGRFPGIDDFVDQLAKPESPPQFTAFFSEFTHDEANRESRYDLYYHIYAGDDANVKYPLKYSVYLRNKFGDFFYVTENCNQRGGVVEKNDFRDISTHCVSVSNLDEICVDINGAIECGFGKVTSSFAVDFANDFVVKEEAKRNINSVKDCVADNPRLSPLFGSVIGNTPLPGTFSLANTGIVRVCSINNPGAINRESKFWQPVGECGTDKEKIDLGLCWIDLRSVSLNDANKINDLSKELKSKGIEVVEKNLKFEPISDEKASEIFIATNDIIEEHFSGQEDIKAIILKVQDLRKLTIYSAGSQIKAKALMLIGDIFSMLGEQSKVVSKEEDGNSGKGEDNKSKGNNGEETLLNFLKKLEEEDLSQKKFDEIEDLSKNLESYYQGYSFKADMPDNKIKERYDQTRIRLALLMQLSTFYENSDKKFIEIEILDTKRWAGMGDENLNKLNENLKMKYKEFKEIIEGLNNVNNKNDLEMIENLKKIEKRYNKTLDTLNSYLESRKEK